MALESSNVRVAVTGALYSGPVGSAAPESATSVLDGDYADLGFVSGEGVTVSTDRSSNDITAWQNSAKVRTVVTDSGVTVQATLIETKDEVLELFHGAKVVDNKISVNPGSTGGRRSFVLDVIDGDIVRRAYIPEGEVTEIGDQVFANGEPIGYPITVSAYSSTELNGDSLVWMFSTPEEPDPDPED